VSGRAGIGGGVDVEVAHPIEFTKHGRKEHPWQVDGITGATISSDAIANLLWTPSADADANLLREGVDENKIDLIGNIMIDSFELLRSKIESSSARESLGMVSERYGVLTLHRPSNVDDAEKLRGIIDTLEEIAASFDLIFVSHPRTMKNLREFKLLDRLSAISGVKLLDPLPYIDFMNIVTGATLAITDSGGLQEETTYLGIPCLTLRENTERPITVSLGTNKLVSHPQLLPCVTKAIEGDWPRGSCPPLWDGKAAQRAARSLEKHLFP